MNSPYSSFPLSFSQHHLQVAPVWISPSYFLGRDRCLGEKRLLGCHQLPSYHGDHSPLPPYHGNRIGIEQDGGDLHCTENSARRYRPCIYLCYLREILRRGDGFEQHGHTACRATDGEVTEARRALLPSVSGTDYIRPPFLSTSILTAFQLEWQQQSSGSLASMSSGTTPGRHLFLCSSWWCSHQALSCAAPHQPLRQCLRWRSRSCYVKHGTKKKHLISLFSFDLLGIFDNFTICMGRVKANNGWQGAYSVNTAI